MTEWPLLGFCVFVGLLAVFVGWLIDAAQKSLDRHLDGLDAEEMRQALRRFPP